MKNTTIQRWRALHTWTALISTPFMLLLCLTGLPLLFHHEIDSLLGNDFKPPRLTGELRKHPPRATVDQLLAAARQQRSGDVVQYFWWDEDEPGLAHVVMGAAPDTDPNQTQSLIFDARTAVLLGQPKISETFIYVVRRLHVDMFGGLWGELFLGAMGFLFFIALVSGAVVYAPFMRRLHFGTVRHQHTTRTRWLDIHNVTGIATLVWASVVALTGTLNTWAMPILSYWQTHELSAMVAPYANQPAPEQNAFGSVDRALLAARAANPAMRVGFIAMPGTPFSSRHHYAVFMKGATALTSRMLKPVLIDARTSELTDSREPPWYLTTLLLSQPLHFGDYGGGPLRVIWALLDGVVIVVLGSGVYLWLSRRKKKEKAGSPGERNNAATGTQKQEEIA